MNDFAAPRPYPGRIYAVGFAVFALIGFCGVFVATSDGRPQTMGGRLFGAAMFLVCGSMAACGTRAGKVVVEDGRITIRTFLGTRRFAVGDVHQVQAPVAAVVLLGYQRHVLGLSLRDGRKVRVDDVNGPRRGRASSEVPAIAKALDDLVRMAKAGGHG